MWPLTGVFTYQLYHFLRSYVNNEMAAYTETIVHIMEAV